MKKSKYFYLAVFIIGLIFIFNNTGWNFSMGHALPNASPQDSLVGYTLISLFGFCAFFIELILEKLVKIRHFDTPISEER